jgi:hypothetical protein
LTNDIPYCKESLRGKKTMGRYNNDVAGRDNFMKKAENFFITS